MINFNKTTGKLRLIIVLIIISLLCQNCATILGGSRKGVRVKQGSPENARIYYNGAYYGTAPTKVVVRKQFRQGNSKIEIKFDGYETATILLTRKISVGFCVLDVVCGFFPLAIDFITGDIYKPKPRHIRYFLEPDKTTKANDLKNANENTLQKTINPTIFKIGDIVIYKNNMGKMITGKIVALNDNSAIVEHNNLFNQKKQTEVRFEFLHKSE